jgi:hypothetical protein
MTTCGVLIYAFNSKFDYVKSAEFAARQAKKFLNLPVTLVTNVDAQSSAFDTVINVDSEQSTLRRYKADDGSIIETQWFNQARTTAYEVSPYDKTLLIDADYFMYNSSLAPIFETNEEFLCYDEIVDLTGLEPEQFRLNKTSIPMQWATVIYFTKCEFSEAVFTFMNKIKENWEYYALLYNFRSHQFRNDFALSIALQALSGYSTKNHHSLPGKLHTLFSDVTIKSVTDSEIVYIWPGNAGKTINNNIHNMNKLSLDLFYATA